MVLGKVPANPNSNANSKPNPNSNQGESFLGGDCPDTEINIQIKKTLLLMTNFKEC